MADVTREEFDALVRRVNLLDGSGTTPEQPAVPRPVGITLGVPQVQVDKASFTVVATAVPNESLTATYFQIAVRGPGATDLALHPGQVFTANQPVTLTGRGTGSFGSYDTYLAYSLDGTTWVDGPKTTFEITVVETPTEPSVPSVPVPPGGGGKRLGLVGRSGLPFNSLVFRQSTAQADEFGKRRGVPMDGLLFFTPRQRWEDFRYTPSGQADWVQQGRIVVCSMPHAPESEGNQMNERGANDAYKQHQRELGKSIVSRGLNKKTYVIRVDWECNGNWYKWSANRPGGWQALRQALINYVTNVRAGGATEVLFDLCFNKGPNQAGAAFEIFPGAEYIDVIGIDQYDMWAPSFNDSDWEREMAKPPSMRSVAAFARKHGIMWAHDEGGNTHGGKVQGGDNPIYWELVKKELQRGSDNLAWHVTYDDAGAPNTLKHDFNSNPKSWPTYKKLWTP